MTEDIVERKTWRCYHCDEVFVAEDCARRHFGSSDDQSPACLIKAGAEGSLLVALRRAEKDLEEFRRLLHDEASDSAKAYYAQQTRHAEQMRGAEELGYERGLADGRAQLATEHALGFKAGIEAGAEAAASWRNPAAIKLAAGEMTAQELRTARAVAGGIEMAITSLPTPPSPLPEILEAMRPMAEQIAKADAARSVLGSVTSMHVACDHLRAIAAVFTKHGGKIDVVD